MELRDFFAELDFGRFLERLRAFAANQSEVDLQHSTDETSQAIPLVRDLDQFANQNHQDPAQPIFLGALIAFVVAYREAEDMGYEW